MDRSPIDVVATLGAFDGLHRAHQALLRQVVDRARHLGVASLCVTFEPHPDIVLYPERQLTYLTDSAEKERLVRALGIDHVRVLPFTRELSMLRPDEFIDLLQSEHHLVELWLGPDAAFGRARSGTFASVVEIARQQGFALHMVPPFRQDHEIVSSTLIRSSIAQGDVERAARLLGRHYRLSGPIVEGAQRGRLLGFPTANVQTKAGATVPADGVYAAWAWPRGKPHLAAVNLGGRPTFGETERLLEVHLIDFQGDLYGETLAVDFVRQLRGVQRFAGPDALVEQIRKDVAAARDLLAQSEPGVTELQP